MMIKWTILVLVFSSQVWTDDAPFAIGGIFYEDAVFMQKAFEVSAKKFNLSAALQTVTRGDILRVSELVEELSELGVVGVIDGTGGRSSEHIQSVCDMLELPHVLLQNNDFHDPNWSTLNLYPSKDAFNNVLQKIMTHKGWSNFTILYVKGHSMLQVESLMLMGNEKERLTISVRELSGDDYRDVLIGAKHAGYTNFVVDCPSENLELFLDHAQQVALMADEHSYIFLSPDLFTNDLSNYRYGGVNITGFRLGDLKLIDKEKLEEFTAAFNEETGETLEAEQLKTETVLIYDAVLVFNEALKNVESVYPKSIERESLEPWSYGSSLLNFMRTNRIKGLTGVLNFNGLGERTDVTLEILELTPAGYQNIGFFGDGQLKISRPMLPTAEITGETLMTNKTFKVLISLTAPYGYQKESALDLDGNDRYEGFTIDLIATLADMLSFNFEFEVADKIGSKDKNGHWNGMVKQILEEKADFGITDFTMTSDRQEAIDFSMPFMTLGIGVLYKQPSKQPPEMFSFMAVFATEVWYYMLFVQLGLGVILIFVGRISNTEWQNPVPCIEQPEEFSNQFSFANSVWLIIGSVMQQGSEIAPIAVAPRMITSVWWFFTMVMVSSYTGTLVAFLTVEKNVLPFEKAEELYGRKGISYGAMKDGSTANFFRDARNTTPTTAIYRKMFTEMEKNDWLVKSNDLGVDRAEKYSYAVFMESTSIEYYIERHCDLLMVGGLLDSKSYGIGMFKGSKYKKFIDDALLKLKERGVIQKLKDKWWKELHGGGKCEDKREEEQKQLGMKNMLGAFVVLGVGCVIGLLISILDMLWGVLKRSLKYKTSYRYELVEELKFALTFSGDVKPVRKPNKAAEEGSSEALADVEAEKKDELRSLHSVRSSCSRRTSHSHGSKHSKHSSRSQSVAFARMRKYD